MFGTFNVAPLVAKTIPLFYKVWQLTEEEILTKIEFEIWIKVGSKICRERWLWELVW